MTKPKVVRNVYCTDDEDRVIRRSCGCCTQCWIFVASKRGLKNGKCVFGGPFDGFANSSNTS